MAFCLCSMNVLGGKNEHKPLAAVLKFKTKFTTKQNRSRITTHLDRTRRTLEEKNMSSKNHSSQILAMAMKPESAISVAMATFNGSRFIRQQLESITAQTMKPREIVICDDNSSDDTCDIINNYAMSSEIPIRLISNPNNIGYSDNFLKAAMLTKYKYIAFCDQDDIWHNNKLERSLFEILDKNAVLAVHTARLIDTENNIIGELRNNIRRSTSHPPLALGPWTMFWGFTQVFDRRLLSIMPNDRRTRGNDSNNPDAILGHDAWISFLANCFGNIVTINEELVSYRQHEKNVFGYKRKNIYQKIKEKAGNEDARIRRVAWLVNIAKHRLDILEAHADMRSEFSKPNLYWLSIYNHCMSRLQLVREENLFKRVCKVFSNLLSGTYGSEHRAGLGFNRFLEDITLNIVRTKLPTR